MKIDRAGLPFIGATVVPAIIAALARRPVVATGFALLGGVPAFADEPLTDNNAALQYWQASASITDSARVLNVAKAASSRFSRFLLRRT